MKSYDELLSENEALAAQVGVLRKAALNAISLMSGGEAKAQLRDAYDATPTQCLAEIKAEACSAFAKYINDTGELNFGDANFVMQEAHDYAEQLRQSKQSGTWLKDSNVNGGKRQGGAE